MSNSTTKESRRSFLNIMLGSSFFAVLASVFYPIWNYLIPPKGAAEPASNTVLAGTVDELKPNSGKIFRFGSKPGILVRTPQGEFRAFSGTCTHLACTVQYREDFKHIWCACHNGHFSLTGINIAGPPPRPLTPYKVDVKDGKIYVSKIT